MKLPLFAVGTLALATGMSAQAPAAAPEQRAIVALPNAVTWGPAPAILPAGAKLAVLEGDPSKPGFFTMRLSLPAGYTIPPHFHPVEEHVTVLQGTFLVGMGDRLDPAKFTELPAGTFGMIPPGMRHFARAQGAVIIQLHGIGPWSLTYVNPADDPRTRTP
ncbi:MAG: cupin domain-containing protein [Gemmatimonadales bacterium]